MKHTYKLLVVFSALLLLGQGCISFRRGGSAGADGGVFKSINGGQEWVQKVALPTSQGVKSLAGTNVVTIAMDPQDHLAVYAGSRENGLFYSYDGGESWAQAKDLRASRISAVAIDYKNKCTIFAATGNRLLRSLDCNRTFEESYREATPEALVSAITIDPFNSAILYLGTSKGTLLQSRDSGRSWSTLKSFNNRIVEAAVNPRNNSVIYVALANRGVHRSSDGGASFTDFSAPMRKFEGGVDVRRMVLDPDTPDALIVATRYGLLRTEDGGETWTPFTLVTQPGRVEIFSLAVNPQNSKEIYYGTATTFYRSNDGGASWSTKKLPSSRTATALLVNFKETNTVYLGVTEIKK